MAFTSHGHQIMGSIAEFGANRMVARCGGPGLCSDCSKETLAWQARADRLVFFKGKRIGIFVYDDDGKVDADQTAELISYINAKVIGGK